MIDTKFILRDGRREDAPAIGRAVVEALHQIAGEFAGTPDRLPLVYRLFSTLAARDDSQYSYLNTIVAEDADGNIAGAIVSYDGERLHELRRAFIDGARAILDKEFDEATMADETVPDEIYLDSLTVFSDYRGLGLGRQLIAAAIDRHRGAGKPVALLCDPTNPAARRLYERIGFKADGTRDFAGTQMDLLRFIP